MNPQVIHALTGVVAVLLGGLFIIIPTAGLTIRFALRPLVQSWIEVKERQLASGSSDVLERRISMLEAELQHVQHSLQYLTEAADFQRRLEEGRPSNHNPLPRTES